MTTCGKCGCELDDMADCCPGCMASVQSLLSAIEGSYEGMKHSDLVETCKMLARGRAAWQREYEAEKRKVTDEDRVFILMAAIRDIYAVATGERQVADNDTEGMSWIAKRISSLDFPVDTTPRLI